MTRHAILVPYHAWGHLRPESALAVTLLRRYTDLVISFLCEVDFAKRAKDEMSRQCMSDEERNSLLSRIRVIAYGYPQPAMTPERTQKRMSMDPRDVHDPLMEFCIDGVEMIDKVMDGQTFVDKLGQEWGPVGAVPKILVADLVMGNVVLPVKEKHNVWVFVVWLGSTSAFTRLLGPLKHGGRAEGYVEECDAIFADEQRRNGRSFKDIAREMWIRDHRVAGDVVRVVGLPPYFQWEDFPQPVYPPPLHTFMITGEKMVDAADGFMLHTVEELEMEAHKDMIQWVRPRRVLCFGPQLPPALLSENAHSSAETLAKLDVNFNASPASDLADCRNDASNAAAGEKLAVDPTIAFLDKALEKYGVHSALYVSFGSMLFPPEAHMKALIETLLNLENPLPFIIPISTGSIPEDMKTAMEQSGRGLVVQWAPQQAILSHPALGWMITHCGGGGMFESLSSGVPVIAWPFMVDQHQHALWISQVLDTGFELLQVRTGTPGRPALRGDNPGGILILGTDEAIRNEIRDTLERAQGEDGRRKRKNAQKARDVILNAAKKGGSAHKALGELEYLL